MKENKSKITKTTLPTPKNITLLDEEKALLVSKYGKGLTDIALSYYAMWKHNKGGTGYDLQNKLPFDIEHITPDYSLYPQFSEAYGFLTRGCPRKCGFCIVSEKEGCKSRQVADLDEFYTGQKIIKLLDPNLLACAEREKLLQQLAKSKAYVDFTQGLDVRLCDRDVIELIDSVKVKRIHFAWDNPKDDLTAHFKRFSEHSNIKEYNKRAVYVLINYNSTHEEDLYRVNTLRRLDFDPYVMIYDKQTAPKITRQLQRYVNNKIIFRSEPNFEKYRS